MSRVVYEPISGARDSGEVNDILDDLALALANINSANLAEEGIDQTVFAAGVHGERLAEVVREVRTVVAPQAFAVLAMTDGDVQVGTFGDLEADEVLRIRTLVSTSSSPGGGFGFDNTGDSYDFRHVYTDGGGDHVVTASNHGRKGLEAVGFIRYAHGDLMRESWLEGPIVGLATIELQYENIGTGDMRVQRAHLVVDKFKRALVS